MNVSFETKEVRINGNVAHILLQADDKEPSALIALANVLLLSPGLAMFARNLIALVQSRRTVAMSELVETLANIGIQNPSSVNTNINQLLQILPQLQSGLMVNPEFNGSFEDSVEISIFRLFNVGIVHGWMVDGSSGADPVAYDHVSKYSYQEAQRALVQSYDLQGVDPQTMAPQEREICDDAVYLKSFLARSASQFTEYGLTHLREILVERSFAVLYRNEHFYTLYKNGGELYTLVSDRAHSYNSEVVWKSLKSVNGSQDAYNTGSFIPVTVSANAQPASNGRDAQRQSVSNPFGDQAHDDSYNGNNIAPQQSAPEQQQMDDDEELARALQEEEDRAAADRLQGIALMQQQGQAAATQKKEKRKSKRMSIFHKNKSNDDSVHGATNGVAAENGQVGPNGKQKKRKKSCIIM